MFLIQGSRNRSRARVRWFLLAMILAVGLVATTIDRNWTAYSLTVAGLIVVTIGAIADERLNARIGEAEAELTRYRADQALRRQSFNRGASET